MSLGNPHNTDPHSFIMQIIALQSMQVITHIVSIQSVTCVECLGTREKRDHIRQYPLPVIKSTGNIYRPKFVSRMKLFVFCVVLARIVM